MVPFLIAGHILYLTEDDVIVFDGDGEDSSMVIAQPTPHQRHQPILDHSVHQCVVNLVHLICQERQHNKSKIWILYLHLFQEYFLLNRSRICIGIQEITLIVLLSV